MNIAFLHRYYDFENLALLELSQNYMNQRKIKSNKIITRKTNNYQLITIIRFTIRVE